jgi:ComF family protein
MGMHIDAVRRGFDAALAILVAPACAACERPLDQPTRGPVCEACWHSIGTFTPPLCDMCGDPRLSWRTIGEARRCPRCRRAGMHITRARAIGEYDGTLRSIVHALKYGGRRSLARPLAALIAQHAGEVLAGADVAAPVPLHRSRKRERGFNQAAEIARYLPLPVSHALRRIKATVSQTDLPAVERQANVREAFAIRTTRDVADRVVVLVDDVSTTGATLDACARVLLVAGAREVRAVTAARVVTQSR